jgi:hypothetical protein
MAVHPILRDKEVLMKHLQRNILLFAILFAVFVLGPPLLNKPFGAYPLMKTADVLDLFTPLVLIPLYWLLFRIDEGTTATRNEVILFLILSALWVEGQGMHLAGNSIGHFAESLPGTPIAALTHFYDEVLSHYMWHGAMLGLAALLMVRQWNNPFAGQLSNLRLEIGAGVLHGINYALMVLEGATTVIGVPFAVLALALILVRGRSTLRQAPILAFFLVTFTVAVLLFLGWGLYWGGLVEPSAVGLI